MNPIIRPPFRSLRSSGFGARTIGPLLAVLLLLGGAAAVPALNVNVAQVDTSNLLLGQAVGAWVSVTDDNGEPVSGLGQGDFKVYESADGLRFTEVPAVTGFERNAGASEGITFMLLIDNSGSMYDTLDGAKTADPAATRIARAKAAVRSFLESMTSPADRVGLVAFNTRYVLLAKPTADKDRVASLLDQVQRPTPDEAYTELYGSLAGAAQAFTGIRGRKVIVALSDGENFPFVVHAGRLSPVYGRHVFAPAEAVTANQEEGISIYGINYGVGGEMDRNLRAIALETGGRVFDAANGEQLAGVYKAIHRQVAGEYLLTYRAGMAPAVKKYLQVTLRQAGQEVSGTRFYFSSVVFGLPLARLTAALILPFLVAFLLLWLLTLLKLERRPGPASLEVLQTRVGRPITRILPLGSAKTVIGGSSAADLTIVGAPQLKEEHATILFDPKDRSYTVVGSGDITVNNRQVRTRKLEPGDVIDVGGATIVFDDPKKTGGRQGP
jgi:Ca-activated chloride channel homolog